MYGKIHYGLYGKKAELKELQKHKVFVRHQLDDDKQKNIVFTRGAFKNLKE
jgi:hypothetical protein